MDIQNVLIAPIITEKATLLRTSGVYSFQIDPRATKIDVHMAVEKLFGVKVTGVRVLNSKPKRKLLKQRRGYGQTAGMKKAYVSLAKDQKITELES